MDTRSVRPRSETGGWAPIFEYAARVQVATTKGVKLRASPVGGCTLSTGFFGCVIVLDYVTRQDDRLDVMEHEFCRSLRRKTRIICANTVQQYWQSFKPETCYTPCGVLT